MKAFETSTTVQPQGDIRIVGVPFAPGTEVEVTINPKRKSVAEFAEAWQCVTNELRKQGDVGAISNEEIQKEINDFRRR